MPLTAYHPLAAVYDFHAQAERWILRRYPEGVEATAGAGRRRRLPAETVIDVFPERQPRRTDQQDAGQTAPQRCTIYTRTRVRLTDTTTAQPSDVLFDPEGGAWQAVEDGRWDEARGYAVVLQRAGRRGMRPWV